MRRARTLAAVAGFSLGTLGVSCSEPRYELVPSGDPTSMADVYRLDRETGQVCAFETTAYSPTVKLWGCEGAMPGE